MTYRSQYTRCQHGDCTEEYTTEVVARQAGRNVSDHFRVCTGHIAAHIAILDRDGYWGGSYSEITTEARFSLPACADLATSNRLALV